MKKTKSAFADDTIRSMKIFLYRYMEDYGYNYIIKLPQFVINLTSRNNCLIELKPKTDEKFWLFDLSVKQTSKEVLEKKDLKIDIEFASQSTIDHCQSLSSNNLREKVLKPFHMLPENLQNKQQRLNRTRISEVNFFKMSWSKFFHNGIVYNRGGSQSICTFYSAQYT